MEHGSRKPVVRALACATAIALALSPTLPSGAAHADVREGDARMMAGGGSVGGGPGAIDHVDKPFGQIIRIIPDHGMSALLYLPALPVDPYHSDEETGHPALQTLRVDRAYADDPDSWEAWGTFEWDADWQEYAWGLDSVQPVYDDNYADPSILYCTVSYSSETVDYRDFYLRATAVVLEDGVRTAIEFEPALFEYAEEWLPEPVEPVDPVEPENPAEPEKTPRTAEGAADRREPARCERRRQRREPRRRGPRGKRAERGERRTAEERRLPRRRRPCLNGLDPAAAAQRGAGRRDAGRRRDARKRARRASRARRGKRCCKQGIDAGKGLRRFFDKPRFGGDLRGLDLVGNRAPYARLRPGHRRHDRRHGFDQRHRCLRKST